MSSTVTTTAAPQNLDTDVHHTAEVLSTRWATRVVHALRRGPMTAGDLLAADPIVPVSSLYSASRSLASAGVITRVPAGSGRYDLSLSAAGQALTPLYTTALAWARRYPKPGAPVAQAPEMIEETLGLLAGSHAVALLTTLGQNDALAYPQVVASLSARDRAAAYQRLLTLEERGLVVRSGTRRSYRWDLGEAGIALGRVYGALSDWTTEHQVSAAAPVRAGTALAAAGTSAVVVASPARTASFSAPQVPERPLAARASAAVLRGVTLQLTFSDAPGPQPASLLVTAAARSR
ncbi:MULTISPECIES: winged helix-turn-helix transcriptional regulator [unclassified Kitasatospora]|uniref:winged helix-turn-helix transcriptional regulator n=1 Tax=unclassified Kitasatospora TaxID=2633591 RepID=UPI0033C4545C